MLGAGKKFEIIKKRMLKSAYRTIFRVGEYFGVHITPNHFYFPIPDTRKLRNDLWKKRTEMVGISMNGASQLSLLYKFYTMYGKEYNSFPLTEKERGSVREYYVNNNRFESVDGEILYSMVRYFKPSRVIEVGSGFSTLLIAQALQKNKTENKNYDFEFISIDPYPSKIFLNGLPGLSALIAKEVQDVPLSEFEKLSENDILFIDSSHVLKIGSDVQYEYLEILPRLKRGVVVHFHDIFLPAEYPEDWVKKEFRFWNEQYILQAFLSFNENFEVLFAASYMHLYYPEELEKYIKSYNRRERWPGSFWIRRVK